MFEDITRRKLRFSTLRGNITIEDVWDLPLTSTSGVSLDDLAKSLNKEVKKSEEESFVTETTKANKVFLLMLDAVKRVIEVKKEESVAAKKSVETKAKKERLLSLIAEKEDDNLKGKSLTALIKMVDEL